MQDLKAIHYRAHWSPLLIGTSSVATLLLVPAPFLAARYAPIALGLPFLLCYAVLAGCALFTVRGYSITRDAVLVRRLFWATRLPRVGLQSAEFTPNAMRGSIRTFGNGGLYSFSGRFWNRALGSYRALVTDPKNTVVLRWQKRTVVISPATAEQFLQELDVSGA